MGRYVWILACDVREREHEMRRYEDFGIRKRNGRGLDSSWVRPFSR